MEIYLGLISGTSMDGVDAALVSLSPGTIDVIGTKTVAYPDRLRRQLTQVTQRDARVSLHELASLNVLVGREFALAANELLEQTGTPATNVKAIGTHGQTIRHSPDTDPPYSLQIGDPATIATSCLITTVADFRSMDIAAGGEGAPLVPPFHEAYFREQAHDTVVINIGGIANITALPANSTAVSGFDTGPGNCLLDDWICDRLSEPCDNDGNWAATGTVSEALLRELMADQYILRTPPKSTGREYFNLAFVKDKIKCLGNATMTDADVQATLSAYTVASIVSGIEQAGIAPTQVFVCGGGVHNAGIMHGLSRSLPDATVTSTAARGIDPDAVESLAFAWLAMQRIKSIPVRMTTGKKERHRILGAVFEPVR